MSCTAPLVARPVRWGLVALLAAVILWASLIRTHGVSGTTGPFGLALDKWFHVAGYAALALATSYALVEWEHALAVFGVVVAVIAFGAGVELLQATVPYRGAGPVDLLANAVGATVGATAWYLIAGRVEFRRRSVLPGSQD